MLKILFGHCENEIYNTELYFENQYEKNWVLDDFAQRVIRDIDASEVVGPDMIKNDIFGTFSANDLSAGVKTLLLIKNNPKKIFNISNCGDNCARYILELSKDRDIKLTLHHVMDFGNQFELKIINDGKRKVIRDKTEYLLLAHQYLRGNKNEG